MLCIDAKITIFLNTVNTHCSSMTKMFIIHSCAAYYYLHGIIHTNVCVFAYVPPTFFIICIPSNDLPTVGAVALVCVKVSCSLSPACTAAFLCLSLIRAGAAGLRLAYVEMGLARQEKTSR